ncbi:polyketide cyclase / dehydrase and lipid transport family protein [Mycobacterium kansasii 732]|nr:polyketide cyclase / dehydrase and lipid transport family protein [Mycobacterium kansasii 732]
MACAERTLSESVPAQPDRVRDFYVDLDNIRLVHPLIVSVQTTDRRETAQGYLQSYRVVDRIPLGPFAIQISYRSRLLVPTDGDVSTEADQWPGVHVRATVSFEPIDAGTRLTERIRITAPRLLAAFTAREAVNAHQAMLSGIRRQFECHSAG